MSKILCTFPGKGGDILWSLPTAREIARLTGEPVDFGTMPYYEGLLPLIEEQEYISKAFVISDWHRTGSAHGDQPGRPQNQEVESKYERVYHLAYRGHPGITAEALPLVQFIAQQQGIQLKDPVVPFLKVYAAAVEAMQQKGDYVVMAFNEQYDEAKLKFRNEFKMRCPQGVQVLWVADLPWAATPSTIAGALAYIGDRSANWVIAKGVDAQCLTYEPHPSRNAAGHLGWVFGCPWGKQEVAQHHATAPCTAAQIVAEQVRQLLLQRERQKREVVQS